MAFILMPGGIWLVVSAIARLSHMARSPGGELPGDHLDRLHLRDIHRPWRRDGPGRRASGDGAPLRSWESSARSDERPSAAAEGEAPHEVAP